MIPGVGAWMGRQKWTRERIIKEIQVLHQAGESLSARNVGRLGFSGMVGSAYKPELFGGWRAAVRAAGLDPAAVCTRRRQWTPERVLGRIRQLHAGGADLSHGAVKRQEQYLAIAAREFFGNWPAAIKKAGLEYDEIRRHAWWSREKIVQMIRELHADGVALSHAKMRQRHSALVAAAGSPRYFGSWERAVEAAGVDYDVVRCGTRWDRAKIIAKIKELHREGKPLNNAGMRQLGLRGMVEAARRERNFGSWAGAVEAAGLDYEEIRRH